MKRERHPTPRQLVDLHDGLLSDAVAARVRRHVDGGARCARRADGSERILRGVAAGPLAPPPERVVRAASALLRETGRIDDLAEWPPARLVLDVAEGELAGVRSLDAVSRHLLWTAGDLEVAIHLRRRDAGTELVGHVLPLDDDGGPLGPGVVTLRRRGKRVAACALDADGRFSFAGLRRCVVALRVEIGGVRLAVPEVVIP